MSKYVINESTLTSIGDAIRAKGGTTDKILVSDLATAITNLPTGGSGGGDLPEAIECKLDYWNYGGHNTWLIDLKKPIKVVDTSTASAYQFFTNARNVTDASHMTFVTPNGFGYRAFDGCSNMTALPKVYFTSPYNTQMNTHSFFNSCNRLRTIPSDFFRCRDIDDNLIDGYCPASLAANGIQNMFQNCYSLRALPDLGFNHVVNNGSYNYTFNNCYVLDEAKNLPLPALETYTTSSNRFDNTFSRCCRLKSITFKTKNGTPRTVTWSNQTINLTEYVGYSPDTSWITNYNSGITAETQVTDTATYEALKDNEDWWTTDINFSRYNHDSAVETINSLPDTATTGGSGNTIKFTGASGASTDGGAINTLTEAEIAVATAKGWTVSLV